MKSKIYIGKIVCACLFTMAILSSCITSDDNNISSSPECAITAFSIADIKSEIHIQSYDGGDSTYTKTLSGSEVTFNIDQLNGLITTVDSLPNWVDLTEVTATVTSYGTLYVEKEDNIYYLFSSGSDTLDFSRPRTFVVAAYDNESAKKYTVRFNKSVADADSLIWTEEGEIDIQGKMKLFENNGLLYVFEENDQNLKVNFNSIQLFQSAFYGVDSEGFVCKSENGEDWERTALKAQTLLAADQYYLYGFDSTRIVATSDLKEWKENGSKNIQDLPTKNVSSVSYSSSTNHSLQNVVMIGNKDKETTEYTTVWYKLSAQEEANDQNWNYINVTPDNSFGLPLFNNMSNIFNYFGILYVIGDGWMYSSVDNGISWRKLTENILVPTNYNPSLPTYALTAGNQILLVQSGNDTEKGHLWTGHFNGLTEEEKKDFGPLFE